MAWKKILLEGDAAVLSDTTPVAITEGATGSAGTATEASRQDHTHASPATWAPDAHLLGSAVHTADTLANLNAKISDATLDDSTASRTPTAHEATHKSGGSDEILLNEFGVPAAAVNFNQQQADGMVLEAVDTPPDSAAEVEGQIYFDTGVGDKHAYVWVP